MKLTRRAFVKANAAVSAAAIAGVTLPASATNLIAVSDETKIKWDKAPCRFCGTGCSVLVGQGKITKTRILQGSVRGTRYFVQPLFVFFLALL